MENGERRAGFLPVTARDMAARGWDQADFVYVTGDAYVDHPSFGVSILSRVLESHGFRVAILAQPDYRSTEDFKRFGRPRLGFLVTSGNVDSMVAHYTVARLRRTSDYYSPGGRTGHRPDRAVIVYCNRIREAYGDIPIAIGGLEASLRRFAHYDYWEDRIRRSILIDARADLLLYGMGERAIVRLAELLDRGVPIRRIRDLRGSVYLARRGDPVFYPCTECGEFSQIRENGEAYARAFRIQYDNQDAVTGRAVVEYYDDKMLVANPPMPPLEREELDRVYALPYMRDSHPDYDAAGGVPAIEEVRFSITHNRGCFGSCNFCAITFHQGRAVRSRSEESVLREAALLAARPDFKGYIHDVGGPTANFREPACEKQRTAGVCLTRKCLYPKPCPQLRVDHRAYAALLRRIEAIPRVRRVFIRSGIRYDYLMADPDRSFFRQLVERHISGQLKVAPEHCAAGVLACMGKPDFSVYEAFSREFYRLTREAGKEQYLVPYLMSSHPGSTLTDAVELAVFLKKNHMHPEQVQDFYPTPGTVSTVMYATGIDPLTGRHVEVARDNRSKQLQRVLLQYGRPRNAPLVREALREAGREDLIGYGPDCLVRPEGGTVGSPAGSKNVHTKGNKRTRVSQKAVHHASAASEKRRADAETSLSAAGKIRGKQMPGRATPRPGEELSGSKGKSAERNRQKPDRGGEKPGRVSAGKSARSGGQAARGGGRSGHREKKSSRKG